MPSAVLKIDGDVSGLTRALGDARAQARATERAVTDSVRNTGRAQERAAQAAERAQARAAAAAERSAQRQQAAAQRAARAAERDQARATRAAEQGAQRSALAFLRSEEQKRRASQMSAQARERAEREATEVARQEARKRSLTAEQEAAVRQRTLERLTRTYETEERRQTAIAKREQRERDREVARAARTTERDRRGVASTVSRGVQQVGSAVMSGAGTAHGLIQDARVSRAMSERTLAQAVRNAGGGEGDVGAARTRVRRFVEQTGMSFADVSQALSIGQARGSTLEAQPGESRTAALERALSVVREANAENADPGQYLAAQGRLRAVGLRGDSLKAAMRFSLAAAQSGQVEVDQIIQQGLPGAARLMSGRAGGLVRGADETDAAFEARRQQVMLHAFRESVATQEVLAASGGTSRHTSNTLAGLQSFMSTPRRQEMALTNLQTYASQINTQTPEGRARAAQIRSLYEGDNALFERDPTRRGNAMRLREGVSPIELATRVAGAMGGNSQAAANIFAGGGTGNGQAFLSNMRNLMEVLGSERGQAVRAMMASTGVSDAQVATHTAAVESDSLAELTRAQERGANALTDNTNALVQLSNRFAQWSAANPLASAAVNTGGGILTGLFGGALANRIGGAVSRSPIGRIFGGGAGGGGAGAALSAARTGAGGLLRRVGGAVFGLPALLSEGLSAVGAYGGVSQDDRAQSARGTMEWERQSARLSAEASAAHRPPPTAAEIGAAVAAALQQTPLTVAPVDAAQTAARAAPPGRAR